MLHSPPFKSIRFSKSSSNLKSIKSNAFGIEVVSVEMPLTMYPINANNNIFSWDDSNAAPITTTIPVGVYTPTTLATELGTQMTADTTDTNTYTVAVSALTKLMTITSTGGAFVLNASGDNSLDRSIGLTKALVGPSPLTLQALPDLSHPRNVLIISNLVQAVLDDVFHSSNDNSGLQRQVLHKVRLDGQFGDIIMEEYHSPLTFRLKSKAFDFIDFRLEDDLENLIDLNGGEWSITLNILMRV